MKYKVGTKNRAGQTCVGWNVYRIADGCALEYYGRANTLSDAKQLSKGRSLPQSDWDTAKAAGHCGGISAPGGVEEDEPSHWWGDNRCAVIVWDRDISGEDER